MEPIEFLGGKYNGGEQILPGAIQTYRATESATGRSVFVHRITSGDDAAQQVLLYRSMAAALVRSPSVRSMVLDMRDEGSDWYVVTETAPQCLLLREWLQFELGSAMKGSDATKIGAAQPPLASAAPLGASPKANNEPGEFTQFFSGGLPAPPLKTGDGERASQSDSPRNSDRPARSGFVQRPNTPMPFIPPAAPRGADGGEFTRLFSEERAGTAKETLRPPREQPKALTDSIAPQAGEYTQLFGKGAAPPSLQEPSALGRSAPAHSDDPLFSSERARPNGPKAGTLPGPSEYTRVLGDRHPAPKLTGQTPKIPSSAEAGGAVKAAAGVKTKNSKMIVFLAALGLLALLLIFLVILFLKK